MPTLQELQDAAKEYLPGPLGAALLGALITLLLLLLLANAAKRVWREILRPLPDLFFSPDARRRVRLRKSYAKWVQSQLLLISTAEDFRDENFADLEAEVEVEVFPRLRYLARWSRGKRRVKRLSTALGNASSFVVLEGDPGSGKSVALRHIAESMADAVTRHPFASGKLPLYVNLKEMTGEYALSPEGLREFILDYLSESAPPEIATMLSDTFDTTLAGAGWFVLLDSFDELPEILSATDADDVIERYVVALYSWLAPTGCSVILASRQYRGPSRLPGARYKILGLSPVRQKSLVRKAMLPTDVEKATLDGLSSPSRELADLVENPLWLGLLVSHMRAGGAFPDLPNTVFETYLERRIHHARTRRRLIEDVPRFDEIRQRAEEIAFGMIATTLAPKIADLRTTLTSLSIDTADLSGTLRELTALKLMRFTDPGATAVTFSHRRLQEYLAARHLLVRAELATENPIMSVDMLLFTGTWREVMVTALQTQDGERNAAMINARVAAVLHEYVNAVGASHELPTSDTLLGDQSSGDPFPWPRGALHLLRLLGAAFPAQGEGLAEAARDMVGRLAVAGARQGRREDQMWSIEFAATADDSRQTWLVERGVATPSEAIRDVGYAQAGRLLVRSDVIEQAIRYGLIASMAGGKLRRMRRTNLVEINRLRGPKRLLGVRKLLLCMPWAFALVVLTWAAMMIGVLRFLGVPIGSTDVAIYVALPAVFVYASHFIIRASPPFADNRSAGLASRLREIARWISPASYRELISTVAAVSISLCRGAIAAVHGWLIVAILPTGALEVVCLLVLCYALTWDWLAILAARRGKHTSIRGWIVMPVVAIPLILGGLRSFWHAMRELGIWKCLGLVVTTFALLATVAAFLAAASFVVDAESAPFVLFAILAAPVLLMVRDLVWRALDWRWQKEWFASRDDVDGPEFLRAIDQTRTPSGFYRLIAITAHRGLFKEGDDRWLFSDLIAAIEAGQKAVRGGGSLEALLPAGVRAPAMHAATGWLARVLGPSGKDASPDGWPTWPDERFARWFPEHLQRRGLALSKLATADSVDELLRTLGGDLEGRHGRAEAEAAA